MPFTQNNICHIYSLKIQYVIVNNELKLSIQVDNTIGYNDIVFFLLIIINFNFSLFINDK